MKTRQIIPTIAAGLAGMVIGYSSPSYASTASAPVSASQTAKAGNTHYSHKSILENMTEEKARYLMQKIEKLDTNMSRAIRDKSKLEETLDEVLGFFANEVGLGSYRTTSENGGVAKRFALEFGETSYSSEIRRDADGTVSEIGFTMNGKSTINYKVTPIDANKSRVTVWMHGKKRDDVLVDKKRVKDIGESIVRNVYEANIQLSGTLLPFLVEEIKNRKNAVRI